MSPRPSQAEIRAVVMQSKYRVDYLVKPSDIKNIRTKYIDPVWKHHSSDAESCRIQVSRPIWCVVLSMMFILFCLLTDCCIVACNCNC
jgi:hypothetical protein